MFLYKDIVWIAPIDAEKPMNGQKTNFTIKSFLITPIVFRFKSKLFAGYELVHFNNAKFLQFFFLKTD